MENEHEPHYKMTFQEAGRQMIVEFLPEFNLESWEDFSLASRGKLADGIKSWCFDLRRLQIINSLILGGIIGFNMVLQAQEGKLTLMVKEGSRMARLIFMSKINRIVNVRELKDDIA